MVTLFIVLAAFVIFDLAASRWGADSTDRFASAEWNRRRHWRVSGDDD